MEQVVAKKPVWQIAVRVLGIIAAVFGLCMALFFLGMVVFDSRPEVRQLLSKWFLHQGIFLSAYYVMLLIPIRFIKKKKYIEALYFILAIISTYITAEGIWDRPHGPRATAEKIIEFISPIIIISIFISNAVLVLKWEKQTKIKESPNLPQSA